MRQLKWTKRDDVLRLFIASYTILLLCSLLNNLLENHKKIMESFFKRFAMIIYNVATLRRTKRDVLRLSYKFLANVCVFF